MPDIIHPEVSQPGPGPPFTWWTEFLATLLLGLAAVGAGWAAYQSARWNTEAVFLWDRAGVIRRQAALEQNRAYQSRILDAELFTAYAQATSRNDLRFAAFLLQRFPPPMRAAMDAWLATQPLKNPNAPPTPFVMKEFRVPEDAEVKRLEESGERALSVARKAKSTADEYVLVTVPFAFVSLFCGISTKFETPGIRTAIIVMAVVALAGATLALSVMPVT